MQKNLNSNKFLLIIFLITFFSAIGASFYHYYYTKNYDYLVETECDPDSQNCFFRDCDGSPDDCPPNGFSYYKQYNIKAYDFDKCTDGYCKDFCEQTNGQCTEIACGESEEDTCEGPTQE